MINTPPIWNCVYTADLRTAGPAALLVASFLMYKTNIIGFFRMEAEEIARATAMSLEEVESTLAALEKIEFLRYDASTQMFWIIDYATWTIGHLRANNRKMIAQTNAEFSAVPAHCNMRVDFLWQHALMLRLEPQCALSPSEAGFDSGDDIPADLLPKFPQHKASVEQFSLTEI